MNNINLNTVIFPDYPNVILPENVATQLPPNDSSMLATIDSISQARLNARFTEHVTYRDVPPAKIAPNTHFTKTWKFTNDGTLDWPLKVQLIFVSRLTGNQMGGPDSVPLFFNRQLSCGETIDISVPLTAPAAPGEYTGFWKLADENGKKFGQRVRVRIDVTDPNAKQVAR